MDQLQRPGLVDRVGVGPVDPHLEGLLEDVKTAERSQNDTVNDVRLHLLALAFTTTQSSSSHACAVLLTLTRLDSIKKEFTDNNPDDDDDR